MNHAHAKLVVATPRHKTPRPRPAVLTGVVLRLTAGVAIPLRFAIGTAILTVVIAAVGSLPPAWLAALRDPVSVMRTP